MKSTEALNSKTENIIIQSSTIHSWELTHPSTNSSLAKGTKRTTDDFKARMIASNYIKAFEKDNLINCWHVLKSKNAVGKVGKGMVIPIWKLNKIFQNRELLSNLNLGELLAVLKAQEITTQNH